MRKYTFPLLGATALAFAIACGGGNESSVPAASRVAPTDYTFTRNSSGNSSVSYTGQTARHVLTDLIRSYTNGLDSSDDATTVLQTLTNHFKTVTASSLSLTDRYGATVSEQTLADISSTTLEGKVAGNDTATDHVVWTNGNTFKGWNDTDIITNVAGVADAETADITTPEGLVWAFFHKLASQVDEATPRVDTQGNTINSVYQTEKRQDLDQLIQKYLWGAIGYSQATDDYMDIRTFGKGLRATGNVLSTNKDYTALEHAWDEAFGYFGAPRDMADYTDADLAAGNTIDTDGDGLLDLKTERVFGHAGYAARRDNDANDLLPDIDLTGTIFTAFLTGRQLIANGFENGSFTTSDLSQIMIQRDIIVGNWERVILATSAYYANETIDDIDTLINATYTDFDEAVADYGKHWSELKGFALALQFNPDSSFEEEDFVDLHNLIRDFPELDAAQYSDYKEDLEEVSELLLNKAEAAILIDEFDGSGAEIGVEGGGDAD